MILTRSCLPAWVKPVADCIGRFSVFYVDGPVAFQYVFTTERERVSLVAQGWWDDRGGAGWNGDVRQNPFMPIEVMVAAGLEAQRRAGKRPKKSPWWWVVKTDAGGYVYDDNELTPYASAARTFTHQSDAEDCALSFPSGSARVVRVRARGAT